MVWFSFATNQFLIGGLCSTPVNGGVCRTLAEGDATGEMERAKGFEPSTLTLAT